MLQHPKLVHPFSCVMLLNLRKLHSHVSKHQLSLQEYKDRYLAKSVPPAARQSADRNSTGGVRKPSRFEVSGEAAVGGSLPPTAHSLSRLSDRLAEVCRVRCNVCTADVQYDELLRHLRSAHGLATKEGYGEYRFSLHRLHACHLCDRQVMFTRKNVGAHTLKVHHMVFPEYARQYLEDVPHGKNGAPCLAPGSVQTF
jgi:hypothetical protein